MKTKHDKSRTKVYQAWISMKSRCSNTSIPAYRDYGARGIKVCPEWMSFEKFYADMGDPPEGHSLDRINNDGDYEPSNCKWSTKSEQAKNRRKRSNCTSEQLYVSFSPLQNKWLVTVPFSTEEMAIGAVKLLMIAKQVLDP